MPVELVVRIRVRVGELERVWVKGLLGVEAAHFAVLVVICGGFGWLLMGENRRRADRWVLVVVLSVIDKNWRVPPERKMKGFVDVKYVRIR